jgi:flagellar hook-associated protein 2
MQKSIDDWDVKLQSKQDALTRQYAALEVALGKMKDQSSWLAGQIANLPSASSSS